MSDCSKQIDCLQMENISVTDESQLQKTLAIPATTLMALNVRAAMNLNTASKHNEVIMIGILIHNNFRIDKAPPKPPFEQHYCRE